MHSRLLQLSLAVLLWVAFAAVAQESGDAVPEGALLSGKDIYSRVLENRLRASHQKEELRSTDEGGNTMRSALSIRYKDFSDEQGRATGDALSKSLIKYTEPRDMRGSGYLLIQNQDRPHDQFVYLPSARKVRRVNLGDTIMGTDFTVEDVVPRSLEDSDYRRLADELVGELACYVVEVVPRESSASQYSRLHVYVEKARWVPIRTRYWDGAGVEVKEYRADPARIETVNGVHVPRVSRMRSLHDRSATERRIVSIEHDADLRDTMFSISRLKRR